MKKREGLSAIEYAALLAAVPAAMLICICVGSVEISASDVLGCIWNSVLGRAVPEGISASIILGVRLPRVLCAGLIGAALSLCGGAMQGLLRNPLADGSTLGVSSGASLGAAAAIAFGIDIPGLPFAGTAAMSMIFAFASLLLILAMAYKMDCTLSTDTIILIGVIFSMFAGSAISFITTFAGNRVKQITFWMMGSLADSSYLNALILFAALAVFGIPVLCMSRELNAFALGEDNAANIGVPVKKIKLAVLICVSGLIGICVSVGGTIGFVGLVIPHMTRMAAGANHRRLLPAAMLGGAVFLMLADLVSRVILSPLQLPIGVVTSFIGAIVFFVIFFRSRRAG